MKAIIFRRNGGPEVLEYVTDFPEPQIADDEALLEVKACALNHLDIWVRQGLPALKLPLPHISGCDTSGVIAKLGKACKQRKIGEAVAVFPGISCQECAFCKSGRDNLCNTYQILGEHTHGSLAQFVKVKERNLFPKPKNLSFEETAAFPLTFLTAWHMLKTHANLKEGQGVLVLGAGSGIGVAAIQIAKLLGAKTIVAAVSAKDKLNKVTQLGATTSLLLNPEKPSFYKEILKATGGAGVDVVFEHVGPATMKDSVRSLKKGGIIITCGATTGPEVAVDLRYFFTREIRLQGSIMGTYEEFKTVLDYVGQGKLKPVIDSVFPLEQTRQAQEKMLSRNFFGKIIIKP